ncbi:hypothetical protein K402DRAFT_421094 [Aulographum hederae CBS 113979]|uniref:CCZ1/INTU/HSP4 first Longin domain-containing protein n=1 Tax=Aulographum hederae CBS 113979 TaxID=1176131 RepID=A0A6G1H0A1_9PEZI|nr:hypothetical protein K402DRAFT_421094 [Aulographum hederae CBS 113979]
MSKPPSSEPLPRIIPAQLASLAIYSPILGRTDDTFRDQIVFYYSRVARERERQRARSKSKSARASPASGASRARTANTSGGTAQHEEDNDAISRAQGQEEENEKLRQVGLAQGMVNFAKSFSEGEPVDSVDTEHQRVVLREVESGWWILAAVDLTQIPSIPPKAKPSDPEPTPTTEYSSREVSPPELLLEQLLRAYHVFLLHHGTSLSDLYVKLKLNRPKFCGILSSYWTRFAQHWDVLLHGNPAVQIYNGIKLAAGGELGVGVGEEEWGSGERAALEGLVEHTEGLVDLCVCRFGEPAVSKGEDNDESSHKSKTRFAQQDVVHPWMGMGSFPGPSDGVVFSGLGNVSRSTARTVTNWVQEIYANGEHAYGVKETPGSDRRKRKRRPARPQEKKVIESPKETARPQPPRNISSNGAIKPKPVLPPGIPPPIISAAEECLNNASAAVAESKAGEEEAANPSNKDSSDWMNYLKLGYGSSWGPTGKPNPSQDPPQEASEPKAEKRNTDEDVPPSSLQYLEPEPEDRQFEDKVIAHVNQENNGHFIIGLKGNLDEEVDVDDDTKVMAEGTDGSLQEDKDWNSRIMIRRLYVGMKKNKPDPNRDKDLSDDENTLAGFRSGAAALTGQQRLRVVVYVRRPFIFTFLFDPTTATLSMPSFYRTLHLHIHSLIKPLTTNTSPSRVRDRLLGSNHPYTTTTTTTAASPSGTNPQAPLAQQQEIFDLIYDPKTLTLHTSLPNIPEPGSLSAEGLGVNISGDHWTRLEALNVHAAILATVAATRKRGGEREIERTLKTGRGWWVVWMRVSASDDAWDEGGSECELDRGSQHDDINVSMTAADSHAAKDPDAKTAPPSRTPGDATEDDFDTETAVLRKRVATLREAFLVRRSRDTTKAGAVAGRSLSQGWGLTGRRERELQAAEGWGPRGLAEGIGIDARRYVEGLLSLNR